MTVSSTRAGSFRWAICALLFMAATINYIDRDVISLLKGTLQREFGWSEVDYADIIFFFNLAYATGFVIAGRLIDRIGTRIGFAIAVGIWSAAAIGHAFAPVVGSHLRPILEGFGLRYTSSVAGFIAMRFLLGLGESGNFPAAIKTTAEWFPKGERALATGVFNSGANIGALLTPMAVPMITMAYGWKWTFVITGSFGFPWLVSWLVLYRRPQDHPRLGAAELAFIGGDPPERQVNVPWRKIVRHRQAWAFAIGKFLTDPIWWLYLYWVPDFLNRSYGLDLTNIGPPLIAIYLLADAGSIGGGWLSSSLLKRGWTTNRARKIAMLVCALAVTPMVFVSGVSHLWLAVAIIGLAAAAHQGWSANLFTLTSDMFPRQAVGSVVGFGGMFGAIGGMSIAKITGYILQATGSYLAVFVISGCAYLVALGILHLLAPTLAPATLDT
jgi:ACS family hexuronate transporter-like MFS transporter